MSFILSCCSTADVTEAFFAEHDIHYVCFHFHINGKDLPDDLGKSLPFKEFYQAMRDGADTHTSQVSTGEYEDYFEQFLSKGQDVLHLTLSSGISGTYNSALAARDELLTKYPERKLIIIDSLCASSGYGLIMNELVKLRDAGKSIDEAAAWAEKYRMNVQQWFFTTDLTYLIRGGRVSKVSGAVGQLLNICPLLNVDYMGRLSTRAKIRGKKGVMRELINRMEKNAVNGKDFDGEVFISNSDCPEDAAAMSAMIEEHFPNTKGKISIFPIGTTIGSHTGPGLVAVFFMGIERVD